MQGKFFLWVLLSVAFASADAQPVGSSKQIFGNLHVYGDFKNDKLFYYAPGDLKLAMAPDGKPKFQLLEMRYTGSSAYGDAGEKRFLNIVQFSVSMEEASARALQEAKQQLGSPSVELRPLPVRSVEAFLVAPIGEGSEKGNYRKIGKDGSFQAEGKSGASDKYGFWTERTFTLKLENHEAQLLWEQVSLGQLALSLAYSFYADMVSGQKGDMNANENGKRASDFESAKEDLLTTDTLLVMQIAKSNAFDINIDVRRWPDLLRKIDVNEGVPPAYAALEVRCFDFANDVRPDLAVKGIDIVATGVGGQAVSIPTHKFLRGEPDLFAKQIRFPYAVKLTQPYRYRVVEYTVDGDKQVSDWKTVREWASHLDISTSAAENAFDKREIDIEVPFEKFGDSTVTKVDVIIAYTFRGTLQYAKVSYSHEDHLPIKQAIFRCDKGSATTYEARWSIADGTTRTSSSKYVPEDNYLYLMVPDQ